MQPIALIGVRFQKKSKRAGEGKGRGGSLQELNWQQLLYLYLLYFLD